LAYFGLYLRNLEWHALRELEIGWTWLAAGILVGVVHRLCFPAVWVWIVSDLGVTIRRYAEYNFVYAKSWLGRYLPGKVAMVAARIYFAERLGARRSVIAVSTVMELGVQLLVAAAVGVIGIATMGDVIGVVDDYRYITYALIAIISVMLLPFVFNRLLGIGFRVLDKAKRATAPTEIPEVSARTVTKGIVGNLIVAAVLGVYINLLVAAVDSSLWPYYVFIWGTYSLAGVLGMVFVLAPSGLGVREAVQLPLLTLIVSKEAALAMVVLNRLAEVAIDLIFYVLSMWLNRGRPVDLTPSDAEAPT
jgi:uncharacterized membrane protein YbhN (UPF0104 family)